MESVMVIKVKYGEMLRRFSVRVLESNKLDLDINGLRAKILNLFNFSSDTDVTLTYIDEDGDIVTLVNDDDLHDVMRQQLRFLRIDVHLRNEKNDQSHGTSDGSSTPLTSARSFQNVRSGISEVLKSLPEPLPEFGSQFLLDIASKAAVTSPVLAELAQIFIRLGNSHLNSDSQPSSVPETNTQNVATESSMASPGLAYKDKDCKIINSGRLTKNVGVDAPASVDLNALPRDYIASGFAIGKSDIAAPCNSSVDGKKEETRNDARLDPLREMHAHSLSTSMHDNPHYSRAAYLNDNFINECPFSGVPVVTGPYMHGTVDPVISHSGCFESVGSMFPKGPMISSSSYIESRGSMFHKGVICDGCGARPITGPRYKSQVKDDYDLCSICFAEMGNEAEYIRIDRPVSCRYPRMKTFNRRHPFAGLRIIDTLKNSGKETKLDGCFVADVNVLDGTVMAPSTPFTKIWRLRNSGSLNWPHGTQLVWVGGDKFSRSVSVEIEVPAGGLPLGQEIDIAVDFTSPSLPGHYLSYWKMACPSGQRFGQRVWVLIQVDAALERPDSDHSQALDLNLPPIGSGDLNGHEDVEKNSTPAISDGVPFPPCDSSPIAEPVKPDHNLPESGIEQRFIINNDLLVGKSPATSAKEEDNLVSYPTVEYHGVLPRSTTKVSSVSYPLIDFSEPIPAATPPSKPTSKVSLSPASSEKVAANNVIEETLLKTLGDMGFKQVDLNKEVLRRTGYDLGKSVDELCGVAEWDPMLQELEEMGFGDKEMNRILLMKNNGSMKRVVMELIYGDKA